MSKKWLWFSLVALTFTFSLSCTQSIKNFKPSNPDEENIKQVFLDLQEGMNKQDDDLFDKHFDENITWIGKNVFESKESFREWRKRNRESDPLAHTRHSNASFSNIKINFKSEDSAQVLIRYTDREVRYALGAPALWEMTLKKVKNGKDKWVIIKKMSIPKELEHFYQ